MATLARARFRVSVVKVHGQSPYIKLYQKYYNYTTCSCNHVSVKQYRGFWCLSIFIQNPKSFRDWDLFFLLELFAFLSFSGKISIFIFNYNIYIILIYFLF